MVDGIWRDGGGQARAVLDPATGRPFAWVRDGDADDVEDAVAGAARALGAWRGCEPGERARVLYGAAERLEARRLEVARALTLEQGKPVLDSVKEVDFSARVLRYYADMANAPRRERRNGGAGVQSAVVRQAVGVCALIAPNNYPVELLVWKLAPALSAGCTVVVKPAEETPLSGAAVVACLREAGAPPGVVQYLPGPGEVVGEALVAHPLVRRVAVTGSTATGKRILAQAAGTLKRVSLELGGQTPLIVFADADLGAAVPQAVRRTYSNMGQVCIGVNRMLVDRRVYAEVLERFVDRAASLSLGPGLKPGVAYGPLVSEEVRSHVRAHVEDARARGAVVHLGGGVPGDLPGGFFYSPTVLADVPAGARVLREESFGPVVAFVPFDTPEEAVALANDTPYGLAAYVYTNDPGLARYAAKGLEVGGVGVNLNDVTELDAPFGGWKESGIGRELGPEAFWSYTEMKHVRWVPASWPFDPS